MTDEPDDNGVRAEVRALMNRGLIKEANRREYSAERLAALIDFTDRTYPEEVFTHPSFPGGVFSAFEQRDNGTPGV